MNTIQRHAPIERQRFAQHAIDSLGELFGSPRRSRRADADRSSDASKVREMAYAYSKTDPGFAADLYAAAARHEGLDAE